MSQLFDYFVVVGLVPLPPSPLDDDENAVTFMPQVIDRYPLQEATGRCGYECPPTLPFFAIPEGALRTDAEGEVFKTTKRKTQDRFFTFVLTDGVGASYYGGCLQRFFPSVDGKSPLPRSICVLSRIPAFVAFRDVLALLHTLTGGASQFNSSSKHFLQSFFSRSRRQPPGTIPSLSFERGVRLAEDPLAMKDEVVTETDSWMKRFRKGSSVKKDDVEEQVKKAEVEEQAYMDVVVPDSLEEDNIVSITTPDGRQLQITVPPGTEVGTTLRIPIPPLPSPPVDPPLPNSTAPAAPTSTVTGRRKRTNTLMNLMTGRSDSVPKAEEIDPNIKWEHSLLRVVFPLGLVGLEIAECALVDTPTCGHSPAVSEQSTATLLEKVQLENEKLGKQGGKKMESLSDQVLVAYISEIAQGCAASLMGLEVGDIIVEVSDVPILGDASQSPARHVLKCVDSSEALSLTVLKRQPVATNERLRSINAVKIPLEHIISYLVDFTPIPPRGADLVAKVFEGTPPVGVSWSHGEVSPLPFVEPTCLAELAQSMETRDVITLIEALLQEQRVCVLSHDVTQLTPVCEALRNLMFPLKWQHAYIPLLPKELLGYLEAPIPFVVGLDEAYINDDPMVAEAVEASDAVTVRLNLKSVSTEGPWSSSVHVPDNIQFVSMSQHLRDQLTIDLDEAFRPFRECRKAAEGATSSSATTTANSYWRRLGGTTTASRYQHPLTLTAALAPELDDEEAKKQSWRQSCDVAQRACFRAIAKVLCGYDCFLTVVEIEETEHDSGGLRVVFERDAFMAHHRHELFMEDAAAQATAQTEQGDEDSANDIHVAPLCAKFAENIISTQLFEAFLEETSQFSDSAHFVYFKKCSDGTHNTSSDDFFPSHKHRAVLTTSPMTLPSRIAPSFFSYGIFPRLDGAKLTSPPQAEHAPELLAPPEDLSLDNSSPEELHSPRFFGSGEMSSRSLSATKVDLDRDSGISAAKNRLSRSFRDSGEWNQTMNAKLLFAQRSLDGCSSDEEDDEDSQAMSSDRDGDDDYYEHDFKVFSRTDSEPSDTVKADEEGGGEESKTSDTPKPTATAWSQRFSLKSATQAMSASMSAVTIATRSSSPVPPPSHKSSSTSEPASLPDIPDPTPLHPSTSEPLPPKKPDRPLVSRWDPSNSHTQEGKSSGASERSVSSDTSSTKTRSLWDKSALTLQTKSRQRKSEGKSRRGSQRNLLVTEEDEKNNTPQHVRDFYLGMHPKSTSNRSSYRFPRAAASQEEEEDYDDPLRRRKPTSLLEDIQSDDW